MGRKSDPFAAYSMPPAHPTDNAIEVPEGYVVGTAAVLGGGKGLVGNEGPGRDASGDRYLYGVVKGLFKQSDPVHERMSPEEMVRGVRGAAAEQRTDLHGPMRSSPTRLASSISHPSGGPTSSGMSRVSRDPRDAFQRIPALHDGIDRLRRAASRGAKGRAVQGHFLRCAWARGLPLESG